MSPDAVAGAVARLRARGERVTRARRAVLRVLSRSAEHLSADDIAEHTAAIEPGLHRATIYRTLESLCASGIAVHVHLAGGATTYHLREPDDRPHLHVLCGACGAVLDAPADLLDDVSARLMAELGFTLEPEHTALLGRCADCSGQAIADNARE